ncbi:MAG: hypothetical protein DRI23_13090 [Candidatus Cloacimonadota bacterium]|nr:MAG: hypothetical protein DRI23_13090 [Candidatus Cloacimonadota bacterium]
MKFNFKEVEIVIKKGDLLKENVEAIVNPANTLLKMGGGLAKKIKDVGGDDIEQEVLKYSPIDKGEVVVSSSGKLKFKYVLHTATVSMDFETDEEIIRKCTENILKEAERLRIKSIGIPALGCGTGRFPPQAASKIMAQEVFKFVHFTQPSHLKKIVFVLFKKKLFDIFAKNTPSYINYIYQKIQKGPFLTVDGIISINNKIVLIERKNPPFGWALPGGFVDWQETVEEAVKREVEEETNIKAKRIKFFGIYSSPTRDPRFHTVSCVYIVFPENKNFRASSDAKNIGLFSKEEIKKMKIAFDHRKIIEDYWRFKKRLSSK